MLGKRVGDFKIDDEVYGKYGEDDFIRFCEKEKMEYIDVSKYLIFQIADIDFIVSVEKIKTDINNDNDLRELLFSKNYNNRKEYKFEIKTDTRSFITRNVVYEVISHDCAGCLAESKADFVYYLFVEDSDNSGKNLIKKEVWIIDLYKWRNFLRINFFDKNGRIEENKIWTNNFNKNNEKVGNILCNIEVLEKNKVAKRIY